MSSYEHYRFFKREAYQDKAIKYRFLIDHCPKFVLDMIFPVAKQLNFQGHTSALDIGSGTGIYSYILRKRGHSTEEIEPFLENMFGNTNVHKITFEKYKTEMIFDKILLIDVLEHLKVDAVPETLRKISKLLSKNGELLIKVPNCSSISGLESHFGDHTHVSAFNETSLRALLEANNFKVVKLIGLKPNLSPFRFICSILAAPLTISLTFYLKSHGVHGILHSPSIFCIARSIKTSK